MLLNISKVPFSEWSKLQTDTALNEFESVRDVKFPKIKDGIDESNIKVLVDEFIGNNLKYFNNADRNNAVYIFGDDFITFHFVQSLLKRGIKCVAPQFNRSDFAGQNDSFKRFREYKGHS